MKTALRIMTVIFAAGILLQFIVHFFSEDIRYHVTANYDDDLNFISYSVRDEWTTKIYSLDDFQINLSWFTSLSLAILTIVYIYASRPKSKNKSDLEALNQENEVLKKRIENHELKQQLKHIPVSEVEKDEQLQANIQETIVTTTSMTHGLNKSLLTNVTLIVVVLFLSTITYSLHESRPPKIIGHFITTFTISLLCALIAVGIWQAFKKKSQSFLNTFVKVTLILVATIGVSRNVGAYLANESTPVYVSNNSQVSADTTYYEDTSILTYSNGIFGVSFKYPATWEPKEAQRASTLVMLYATDGSNATCNLSVIDQDKPSLHDYSKEYFYKNLSKVYKEVKNIVCTTIEINGKYVVKTEYEFSIFASDKLIKAKSLTLTTLNNGKRFMLIINAPKNKFDGLNNDITTMTKSLAFSTK